MSSRFDFVVFRVISNLHFSVAFLYSEGDWLFTSRSPVIDTFSDGVSPATSVPTQVKQQLLAEKQG
jgi:hypothetical protein